MKIASCACHLVSNCIANSIHYAIWRIPEILLNLDGLLNLNGVKYYLNLNNKTQAEHDYKLKTLKTIDLALNIDFQILDQVINGSGS